MAGVTEQNYKSNDEGSVIQTQQVPAMGSPEYRASIGLPPTVPVVASAHLTDANATNGVAYPETSGISPDGGAYPKGTDVGEASNPLR